MSELTLRERLVELRNRLHAEIENDHDPACTCLCGKAGDPRTLASLSKEYRAVLADIEALPVEGPVSASEQLRARVIELRPGGAAVAN